MIPCPVSKIGKGLTVEAALQCMGQKNLLLSTTHLSRYSKKRLEMICGND
jgi:hypothetical protein